MSSNHDWESAVRDLRVRPGEHRSLGDRATHDRLGLKKSEALAHLAVVKARIELLQQRLYAEHRRSVLLVIQAMDAAGKDGTIRVVLSGLNPAGVPVTAFKVPAGPEAEHDYLWRIRAACPGKGLIGVFNRSHYEDVVVVRVNDIVPEPVWSKRFGHIRHFEQQLVDEGTSVVKVFLHVSKDEQARRLQERIDDPEKRWKFRLGDLDDRARWDDFQEAYDDAIHETSTDDAPWFVVPADSNSRRNLAVARLLLDALEAIDPKIPEPEAGLGAVTVV
ncbi:MAG: PPK2 family polyphosphate kinase [Ilumatobacteraceae bacterium]